MLLQGLHALFLGFQILVAWEFLIKGIELRPEVIDRLHLTDINRHIYPYLTVWNLVLHIGYLVACAAEDVMVKFSNGNHLAWFKKYQRNRAFVFETLVFPGSMIVVTFYWILTLMDPLYLFPGPIEDLIPSWINFLIHSGVGLFVVGELLLRPQPWSTRHGIKRARVGATVFLTYAIIICLHRYLTGAWIYPFLELLTWPQRFILFVTLVGAAFTYYCAGQRLSSSIHGRSGAEKLK
ncbi:androgen-dependent TFPI-regulating protein-like [Ischnura elegans]|uniref:androgen-dependent TFPI-regulating protein-like n=1 Tax=Ischnura elegans TaxID=197161 RepID=UPI001ED88CD7|nr:androgen-dependent TFPI-regulating protein-like [Ischnura elegans]XP_046396645.1 androgen-dependent TFPI-regulating protein-like [Ischnura elegans]XP_046396646.1 androgen-dependent TFPI-regulating protein-like [Ischnura elegans]